MVKVDEGEEVEYEQGYLEARARVAEYLKEVG